MAIFRRNKVVLRNNTTAKRRFISLGRIIRYGFDNFIRNSWLSLASTVIMTITLIIIFFSVVANVVLSQTVEQIRDKVDMSIYVVNTIDDKSVDLIKKELSKINGVVEVRYKSASEAREELARKNSDSDEVLEAINTAINMLPGVFNIKIEDINDPSELEKFVAANQNIKKFLDPKNPPSFASERREAINNIASKAIFFERLGIVLVAIFILIAMLVIFNTIRMAIFNRKDEIYMMRLIGANPSFIRGPFIVEAILNGVIAASAAMGVSYAIMQLGQAKITESGISMELTINFIRNQWYLALIILIGLGCLIGIISSLLATRKYLRQRVD